MSDSKELIHRDGNQEVYIVSEKPKPARDIGDDNDFNKVNYWKEETTGVGNPRQELLLGQVVGLLQAIEQRLGRLEGYVTRK